MTTPQEQAAQFKDQYEHKIDQIQNQASEQPAAPESTPVSPEHQALSHVTQDFIRTEVPLFNASSHAPGHSNPNLADGFKNQVQGWVDMALKDPYKGIEAARDSKDPALIDEFHGALTGNEGWHFLVKEGKIPEVQ